MSSIPASTIVSVVPSVVAAGGTGLTGTGLILTRSTRLPAGGQPVNFASPGAVSAYFGASDPLTAEASVYFAGFNGASILPASLLMAQFNQTAVAAYLRGGNISGLTLAQLQAINGSIAAVFDGYSRAGTVNLSGATSFSNAATLIQTALNSALPFEASFTGSIAPQAPTFTGSISGNVMTVTSVPATPIAAGAALTGSGVSAGTTVSNQLSGTPGGIGTYAVSISQVVASETLTATYGVLTVSALASGAIAVGQTLNGTGVAVSTLVTALGTGVGGTGTYYLNNAPTVVSEGMTTSATPVAVTFDSVSGAFVVTSGAAGPASTAAFATGAAAVPLLLTSATGATLSQGAGAPSPSAFMGALVGQNVNWVNFMTHFDPDGGSGNALKQQFAAWKNTALGGNRFGYFCWDPDASPAAASPAASSLGQILKANGDSGTLLIWEGGATLDTGLCAFALGLAASINYQQTNGRAAFAFRQGAGEIANVTDINTATNLLANGYCFYGAYGAANASYVWFQNGQITGPFAWADSFQTEVWLNSLFQTTFLTLFQNSLSVPFTSAGIALIQQAAQAVIQQGLAFGAFAPNTLTAAQIAEVNNAAGAGIAAALQSQGWYLQVNLPSQAVQAARGPWPMTFWYIDRNSVQSIVLSSVLVQ